MLEEWIECQNAWDQKDIWSNEGDGSAILKEWRILTITPPTTSRSGRPWLSGWVIKGVNKGDVKGIIM